ncbi:MAG: hypothetical protein AMK69_13745 [Nitrospira bacterium SG8_3]|nr:MAG: hypothetical protein AMK69_13745 [Nitrospira bacterium SG8_3]
MGTHLDPDSDGVEGPIRTSEKGFCKGLDERRWEFQDFVSNSKGMTVTLSALSLELSPSTLQLCPFALDTDRWHYYSIHKESYQDGAYNMKTQKIAITMPTDLVAVIDDIRKQKGMSRSRLISSLIHEQVLTEQEKQIKEAYNRVFSDDSIKKEQLETALWLEGTGSKEGQEW